MENIKLGGVDTSLAQTSLKQLRETIKSTKDEMLNLEEGTIEYTEALTRAANAQFQMSEINEQVRATAMDLGAVLTNSTRVLQGLAGGYTAFQGISNLLGVENKNLQETFVKLQAAMAVVQGLDGIDGMFKSLKNLTIIMKQTETGTKALTAAQKIYNFVLSMNPIFLLVTVLAAVVVGIVAFTGAMKANNAEIEKNNQLLEDNKNLQEQSIADSDYRIKIMEAEGKSFREITMAKIKAAYELDKINQDEIDRLQQKARTEDKLSEEEKKRLEELLQNRRNITKEINKLNTDLVVNSIKERKKDEEDAKKKMDDMSKEEKKKAEDKKKSDEDKRKAELDELKKFDDDIQKSRMTKYQLELKELEDKYIKEKDLKIKYGQDITDLTKWYEEQQNKIKAEKSAEDAQLEDDKKQRKIESDARFYENQRASLENSYIMMDELDRAAFLNKQTTEFEFAQSTLQNRIDYNNKLLEDTSLTELQRLQIENDNAEARKQIAANEAMVKEQLLNGLNGMLQNASNLFGKETAVGKSIAVASATIATYQSATQAYNSLAGIPVVGPGLGAVAAGVAIASGLKNVKEILKVKVPKASGSGGGSSAISAPSISAPNIPSTLTAVRNVQTESEVSLQKEPIRAYVVESDINKTSERLNTIKKESEF